MRRIGVVTTSYPREAGDPAGHFVAGFARWLAERGAEVEVVAAGPGASSVSGIPVARVAGRGLFYDGGAPDALAAGGVPAWASAAAFQGALCAAVARRLDRWDGVVSHWLAPSSLAVLAAAALTPAGRRPHLAIAHSSDVQLLRRSRAGRAVVRLCARRADLVYSAAHLAASVAGAPGRVVAMGVDRPGGDRQRGRRRFGLVGLTALFLGRLVPVKGVERLLAALPDGLDLIVAGEGPLRADLQAAAPLRARFVGEVRGEAKADLLAACDLVVVPSLRLPDGREEGAPTVVREALAAGRPVVASDGDGVRELLEGRGGGLLVPTGVAALASALQRIVNEPAVLAELAAASDVDEPLWERVGPVLAGPLFGGGARLALG